MDDVQLGVERSRQRQRVLRYIRRVQTEVCGIQHRTDHTTSRTTGMAEIDSA